MTKIQVRRGPASEWASVNPVLFAGEPGFEVDSHIFKVGDGVTPWNSLPDLGGGGGPTPPTLFFLPEDYGAVGDGVADDTAAVQAAIDAANAAGGGIVLLTKRYGFSTDIFHRGGVTVQGTGTPLYRVDADPALTDVEPGLVAIGANARYIYGTSGNASRDDNPGPVRDLIIDGAGIGGAAAELFLAQSAQGLVDGCHVINSSTVGIRLNGMCQNTLFIGCYIGYNPNGASIKFMQTPGAQSTGGNNFVACYIADGQRMLWSTGDASNVWPHSTTFTRCLFEQRQSVHIAMVQIDGGQLTFDGCIFTRSIGTADKPTEDCLVYINTIASFITNATFLNCSFTGGSGAGVPTDLIRAKHTAGQIGTVINFDGYNTASNATNVVCVDGAHQPSIHDNSEWGVSGTPNPGNSIYVARNGASLTAVKSYRHAPQWFVMNDGLAVPIALQRASDTNVRWAIDRDGGMSWQDAAGNQVGAIGNYLGLNVGLGFQGLAYFIDGIAVSPNETASASGTITLDTLAAHTHILEFAANATVTVALGGSPGKGRMVRIGFKGNGTNTLNWSAVVSWDGAAPTAPADGQWRFVDLIYAGTTNGWREISRSGP